VQQAVISFLPLFGALSFLLPFLSSDLAAMAGVSWAGFWLYLLYGLCHMGSGFETMLRI